LQNAAGLGPVAVQSSEYTSEFYYGFDPAPWLDLRPNVQYVYQPGGTARNHADLIVGLRLALNF
jgi:porin